MCAFRMADGLQIKRTLKHSCQSGLNKRNVFEADFAFCCDLMNAKALQENIPLPGEDRTELFQPVFLLPGFNGSFSAKPNGKNFNLYFTLKQQSGFQNADIGVRFQRFQI